MLFRKNSNKSLTPKESSIDDSIDKNYSHDITKEKLNGNFTNSKKQLSKNQNDTISILTKNLSPSQSRKSIVKQLNKRFIELRHSVLYLQTASEEKKKKKKNLINKYDFII